MPCHLSYHQFCYDSDSYVYCSFFHNINIKTRRQHRKHRIRSSEKKNKNNKYNKRSKVDADNIKP